MPAKKVLVFAPYGAWMVHHQLDAVIGAALAHRGCEVVAVICDGFLKSCFIAGKPPNPETCRSCALTGAGVFARMGIRTVQLRSLVTEADLETAAEFSRSADLGRMSDVSFDKYPLGKWCPPSMQSYFSTGEFPLDQEWAVKAIRDQFSNGVLLVLALNRLMDGFKPDQVFSYNSTHFYYRIASELGKERGLPVLVHERGHLNDSFTLLDGESTNANQGRFNAFKAWEDVPLNREECGEVQTYFREREEGKNGFSRFYTFDSQAEDVRRTLRIPAGAPILALFGSGDRELGAFETVQRKTFAGQVEWIRATAEICRKRGWYLVIRHHPSNVMKNQVNFPFISSLMELNREMPDCVRVIMPHERLTSYAILWNADGAVTHFSTMGSETPTRGVLGVCVGDSLYQPLGVEWAGTRENYENALVSSVEKTRDFGLAQLRKAYRGAHYVVFKLGYKFRSFGIRDVYAPDIRVRSLSEFDRGNDPILDRVCDYVMEGSALLPVPDASERSRSEEEERVFLEVELQGLVAKRRAIASSRAMAEDVAAPLLTVFALQGFEDAGIRDKSLKRSREKAIERIDVGFDPEAEIGRIFESLAREAARAKGRYVYVSLPGVDADESVFANSIDFLENEANREISAVTWGGWLSDAQGRLKQEIFTDSKPIESFEEAIECLASLDDPIKHFAFAVMRKDFFTDLIGWLDAMSGFGPREIAASLFNLLRGAKSGDTIMRMKVPMISIYQVQESQAGKAPADSAVGSPAPSLKAGLAMMMNPSTQAKLVDPISQPPSVTGESAGNTGKPRDPAILDVSPDVLRARLETAASAFAGNPGDIEAGLDCADVLARLGEGVGARRVLIALQARHPSDARIKPLLDSVDWKSRQGLAGVFEWNLRGEGYRRLFGKRSVDSYADAQPYVESVPGWMLEGQEKYLFEKVKSLPDGAVILEMGADRGRSTSAMALACKGTSKRIISIDTFAGNDGIMGKTYDFYHEWRGNLERLSVGDRATGIQGYTFDVLPTWNTMVDFAFIDASHEYIDVLNDLKLIYPFVKKGGWIAFHDVEPGWPGPWRVWLEYGIPLLTNHEVVHTLASGRKTEAYEFGKQPEAITRFSFARSWVEDLRRSGDPSAVPLLQAFTASLDFSRPGPESRGKAIEAERTISGMAPHLKQTLNCMIGKDAYFDGYLHYWYALTLEAAGLQEEARRHFSIASRVSYAVPMEQLRRPEGESMSAADPIAEIFRNWMKASDTVIQIGSGDGSLLSRLPGRFKLGLEPDDQLRKHAAISAGIDSFNSASELPEEFADIAIGHAALGLVQEPLALLKSLRGKLKPGGKAVFTTRSPDAEAPGVAGKDLYAWTSAAFANFFAAAGFAVKKVGLEEIPGAGKFIFLVADATPSADSSSSKADWAPVRTSAPLNARDSSVKGVTKTDPRDIPVALVAYRRPEHTRQVIESLERQGVRNLYIFCDAAKGNGDEADVRATRKLVEGISWIKPELHFVENNRGLARSVMAAADHVLSRHETVVLLEDDCVPQRHFFGFMANALDKYRDDESVYGVSGYTVPLQPDLLRRYPQDVYFCPRISSWGWATWKRAWKQLDRDLVSVCRKVLDARIDLDQGGDDIKFSIEGMLQGHVKDVWTLPWVLSVYLNRGCFVYPTVSHIDNIGMDGSGVHCGKTDRYVTALAEAPAHRFPERVFYDPEVMARFCSFYDLALQRT
ncbi:MAG: class I SAM-dependent methyltransferase [Fibrobacteria bacterium]